MSLSEQLDALLDAPDGQMGQGGAFNLMLAKVTNI